MVFAIDETLKRVEILGIYKNNIWKSRFCDFIDSQNLGNFYFLHANSSPKSQAFL